MGEKEIYQWLHQAREVGLSDMKIVQKLKEQGWSNDQIDLILVGAYSDKPASFSPPPEEKIFSPAEKFQKERGLKNKSINDIIDKMPNNYSIGTQIFSRTWELVKKHWKIIISLSLIQSIIIYLLIFYLNDEVSLSGLSVLIISIVSILINITTVELISNEKINFAKAFIESIKIFFQYSYTLILSFLIITGGTLLLIIPGIMMSLAFISLPYIMVTEKKFGLNAIKRSYALAYNNRGGIFTNILKLGIFNILLYLAMALIFIGLIFAFETGGLVEINTNSTVWLCIFFITFLISTSASIFSILFFKNIYHDLIENNYTESNYELEEKGNGRAIIYLFIGIILAGINIYSIVNYDDTKTTNLYNFNKPNSIVGDIELKKLPFEYKPPKNFTNDFNTEYKNGYSSTYVYQIPNTTDKININIYLEENKDNLTAEEYLDINENIFEKIYESNSIVYQGETDIDGVQGYLIEKNYEFYDTKKYSNKIAYVKDEYIIEISLECGARYYLDYKTVFNDSLKSFKLK